MRRCSGTGERWECPITMHLLRVGGSISKSCTVGDEIMKMGRAGVVYTTWGRLLAHGQDYETASKTCVGNLCWYLQPVLRGLSPTRGNSHVHSKLQKRSRPTRHQGCTAGKSPRRL